MVESQKNSALQNEVAEVSVSDFVRYLIVKEGFEDTSVKNARIRVEVLNRYLKENQVGISTKTIEDFLFDLRKRIKNNNSLNTYIFMIKKLDCYAKSRGFSWAGMSEGISVLPKVKPMVDVLTWEEIEKILSVDIEYKLFRGKSSNRLNNLYKTMIRLLAETGCRYEECASLTVKDYYRDSLKISLVDTKNNDSRWVFISPLLRDMLDSVIEGDGLIFKNMVGKEVYATTFIEDLKVRASSCGITKRVHPHLFRHSFATALGKTVNTHEIKDLLGHKDIKSTDGYIHTDAERLRTVSHHHPSKMKYLSFEDKKKLVMDTITPLLQAFGTSIDKQISESKNLLEISLKDI